MTNIRISLLVFQARVSVPTRYRGLLAKYATYDPKLGWYCADDPQDWLTLDGVCMDRPAHPKSRKAA